MHALAYSKLRHIFTTLKMMRYFVDESMVVFERKIVLFRRIHLVFLYEFVVARWCVDVLVAFTHIDHAISLIAGLAIQPWNPIRFSLNLLMDATWCKYYLFGRRKRIFIAMTSRLQLLAPLSRVVTCCTCMLDIMATLFSRCTCAWECCFISCTW